MAPTLDTAKDLEAMCEARNRYTRELGQLALAWDIQASAAYHRAWNDAIAYVRAAGQAEPIAPWQSMDEAIQEIEAQACSWCGGPINLCGGCKDRPREIVQTGGKSSKRLPSAAEVKGILRDDHPANREQRDSGRVAESQAPSIRDGEAGVTPGSAPVVPEAPIERSIETLLALPVSERPGPAFAAGISLPMSVEEWFRLRTLLHSYVDGRGPDKIVALVRAAILQVLDNGRAEPVIGAPLHWRFYDMNDEILCADRVEFADRVVAWLAGEEQR